VAKIVAVFPRPVKDPRAAALEDEVAKHIVNIILKEINIIDSCDGLGCTGICMI